jgi:biotin operon repressor
MIRITDFLSSGEDQAISLSDLAALVNIPERAVKKEILNARLQGELIISTERGYFLSAGEDDLRDYVCKRKAVIKTARKALRPFLNALKGR